MDTVSQSLGEANDRSPDQIKAPANATPEVKAAVASANENGARINRFFERLLGREPTEASKKLDREDARADFHRRRVASLRPDTVAGDGSVSVRPEQIEDRARRADGNIYLRPSQRIGDFDHLFKDESNPDINMQPLDASPLADGMREGGRMAEMAAKATSAAIETTLSSIPLYGAGLKAGQQFAAGLAAAAPAIAAAANSALVTPVANRVPQSPAKIGPLRNLPMMGRKIAEQLASGMESSDHPVRAAGALAARIATNAEGESLVSAARRSAARIAQLAALRDTATSGPKSDTSGKGVAVSVGKIVLNGVKDMQEGVGRLGIELERAIAGTVGDVGAG